MDAARLERAQVIIGDGLLPLRSPLGSARGDRRALDRATVGLHLTEIAASDESQRAVIEVVAVEVVDADTDRAGRDERIEVELRFVEEPVDARHRLMAE